MWLHKWIYLILLLLGIGKPTSSIYFEALFFFSGPTSAEVARFFFRFSFFFSRRRSDVRSTRRLVFSISGLPAFGGPHLRLAGWSRDPAPGTWDLAPIPGNLVRVPGPGFIAHLLFMVLLSLYNAHRHTQMPYKVVDPEAWCSTRT